MKKAVLFLLFALATQPLWAAEVVPGKITLQGRGAARLLDSSGDERALTEGTASLQLQDDGGFLLEQGDEVFELGGDIPQLLEYSRKSVYDARSTRATGETNVDCVAGYRKRLLFNGHHSVTLLEPRAGRQEARVFEDVAVEHVRLELIDPASHAVLAVFEGDQTAPVARTRTVADPAKPCVPVTE